MLRRREFLTVLGASAAVLISRHPLAAEVSSDQTEPLRFASSSMEVQLSGTAPEFLSLNVDGLAQGKRMQPTPRQDSQRRSDRRGSADDEDPGA